MRWVSGDIATDVMVGFIVMDRVYLVVASFFCCVGVLETHWKKMMPILYHNMVFLKGDFFHPPTRWMV